MSGLAIVSGGMDSVTLLYQYKEQIDHVVNFSYGSKHNEKERDALLYHLGKLNKPATFLDLAFIGDFFKSALLKDGEDIPEGHYEDPSMKKTVVPFRNGIMLSIAVGLAESHGMKEVFYGAHAGDHAIYPDCRPDFAMAMRQAAQMGTYKSVNIETPYLLLSKRDIGVIGHEIGVPYEHTWTCYKGQEKHCGKCGACVERKEALEGFDPTEYE